MSKSKKVYVPQVIFEWEVKLTDVIFIGNGFMPFFDTKQEAKRRFPDAKILELEVV